MDDAHDEYTVVFGPMEDQVVADRNRAEAGEEIIDRWAQMGLRGELCDDGGEAVDESIRCGGIMPCDLHPDFERIQFRLIAAPGQPRIKLPRDEMQAVRVPGA